MQTTLLMSWQAITTDVIHLGLAYLLALPIGWDREQEDHTAGIRTFPIVAVATCGIVLVATAMPGSTFDSQSRILQGLITGIGFIGGGAILRDRGSVTGTATAASIFNIAIVGCAVGFGLYHIAIVLTIINLITLKVLKPLRNLNGTAMPGTPAPPPRPGAGAPPPHD